MSYEKDYNDSNYKTRIELSLSGGGAFLHQLIFYMEPNGNITSIPGVGTLAYENSAKPY